MRQFRSSLYSVSLREIHDDTGLCDGSIIVLPEIEPLAHPRRQVGLNLRSDVPISNEIRGRLPAAREETCHGENGYGDEAKWLGVSGAHWPIASR
jgi:hypothetical protein